MLAYAFYWALTLTIVAGVCWLVVTAAASGEGLALR